MSVRRRSPGEIGSIALRFVFLGVIGGLFFAWLMSANGGGRAGLSGDVDCVSFGRGGAHCASHAGETGSLPIVDARGDCISAGRGGLICERKIAK